MRVMTGATWSPRQAQPARRGDGQGGRRPDRCGAVVRVPGILGQYDPFGSADGVLLLVYPNVIAVERQLRLRPADFRLWVCLHEVTHRVQFTANPWLAEHMSRQLALTHDMGEGRRRGGQPAGRRMCAAGGTARASAPRTRVRVACWA